MVTEVAECKTGRMSNTGKADAPALRPLSANCSRSQAHFHAWAAVRFA
jgi:hypothetical protein